MTRPLRIEYPGAVYHITARGNEKKTVFKDDIDRETFLETLLRVNKRYNLICHAYCLMDNHYHLLIETPDGNLSLAMRQLNGVFTQAINKRYSRTGHLFQGRYKGILIQKESHLLEVCRYVVLNPVRAGVVAKPEDWKWSSFRATTGKEPPHPCLSKDWILAQFSETKRRAEKEYHQFVHGGIGQSVWGDLKGQVLLGEDDFVVGLMEHIKEHKDIPEVAKTQRYLNRPELDKLFPETMPKDTYKRNEKITEAVEKYGYTQRAVSNHLGLHFTYVSQIMNRKRRGGI